MGGFGRAEALEQRRLHEPHELHAAGAREAAKALEQLVLQRRRAALERSLHERAQRRIHVRWVVARHAPQRCAQPRLVRAPRDSLAQRGDECRCAVDRSRGKEIRTQRQRGELLLPNIARRSVAGAQVADRCERLEQITSQRRGFQVLLRHPDEPHDQCVVVLALGGE